MSRVRVPDGAPKARSGKQLDLVALYIKEKNKWLVGQAVKTPASHAGNGGSIPPRVTKRMKARESFRYIAAVESRGTRTGANDDEVPPVPIPNTEVKLANAENTCGLPYWKDR